jgi:hypothetical protein
MYFNQIDWDAKSVPENDAFFEEVKKVLRVRRTYPEIFEYFSESLRDANIAKVDSMRDGNPNPLQAYMRYAKDKAVLVVPNYEADRAVSEFKIEIPWKAWGVERSGTFRVTELMTNRVLLREAAADLGSFDAVLPAEQLGIYLIEKEQSAEFVISGKGFALKHPPVTLADDTQPIRQVKGTWLVKSAVLFSITGI